MPRTHLLGPKASYRACDEDQANVSVLEFNNLESWEPMMWKLKNLESWTEF